MTHTSPLLRPTGAPSLTDDTAFAPLMILDAFVMKLADEVQLVSTQTFGPPTKGDNPLTSLAPKDRLACKESRNHKCEFCRSKATLTAAVSRPAANDYLRRPLGSTIEASHRPICSVRPTGGIHIQSMEMKAS